MKKKLVLILLILGSGILNAQQIPNGGFEVIDPNEFDPDSPFPVGWQPLHFISFSFECFPEPIQGVLSSDSHSGDYSIKMETVECSEPGNGLVQRPGGYHTANPGTINAHTFANPYTERPELLSFYYKFLKQGNDSAYIEVMLFNYDSITPDISFIDRIDTVAFSFAYISESVDTYTQYNLPMEYLSESDPSFIAIRFRTGFNCSLFNCTEGTTLWVDDVTVSGGTVGTRNADAIHQQFSVYPNPSSDWFRIGSSSETPIKTVTLCDYQGREVKRWNGIQDLFVIDDLAQGSYLIRLETEKGIATKRLIKTD